MQLGGYGSILVPVQVNEESRDGRTSPRTVPLDWKGPVQSLDAPVPRDT